MIFEFLRLQLLKSVRSVSLSRNLAGGFVIGLFVVLIFINILGLALSMNTIIQKGFGAEDVIGFININLLYLFVAEFLYRFFLQKLPLLELGNFLHLPIKRSKIVHFLLGKSFISPLNIIFPLLFTPFALSNVAVLHGSFAAYSWLFTIIFFSWAMHWGLLLFKTRYGDSVVGLLTIFGIGLVDVLFRYLEWVHPAEFLGPLFAATLSSVIPVLGMLAFCVLLYLISYKYYIQNAYLEDFSSDASNLYIVNSFGFLSRFGLLGEFAELEWKLILRHKKSRSYLFISVVFLLYGLIYYGDPMYQSDDGIAYMYIFVGSFITGVFMIQYGQLFLSWNSANFDFFLCRPHGAASLIQGKYLLFNVISTICFLLSVPYVYFGWDVLLVHFVTYLFNIGVTIHLVINLALWKPKPMDISKSSFFNYEGVGVAQYLMIIPMVIIPYLVFVPFSLVFDTYIGLLAMAIVGITGIIFNGKLSMIAANSLIKNKYEISTSFRQET
jgi:hypothetical protein